MKKPATIAMVLLLTSLAGCESKESEVSEKPLPEVNDENCLPENVAKVTPDDAREQFVSAQKQL
jgi:entry exclusion lipoprotein TrbK